MKQEKNVQRGPVSPDGSEHLRRLAELARDLDRIERKICGILHQMGITPDEVAAIRARVASADDPSRSAEVRRRFLAQVWERNAETRWMVRRRIRGAVVLGRFVRAATP